MARPDIVLPSTASGHADILVVDTHDVTSSYTYGTPASSSSTWSPPGPNEPASMTVITDRAFLVHGVTEGEVPWPDQGSWDETEGWKDAIEGQNWIGGTRDFNTGMNGSEQSTAGARDGEVGSQYTITSWGVWGSPPIGASMASSTETNADASIGEIRYPLGHPGGTSPAEAYGADFFANGYNTVYSCYEICLSSNFSGHESGVNKWWYLQHRPDQDTQSASIIVSLSGQRQEDITLGYRFQGFPDVIDEGEEEISTGVVLTRGSWHTVEEIYVNSSGDSAGDGGLAVWVNGVQRINRSDLTWNGPGQTNIWVRKELIPVHGGTGGTSVDTMYVWMSHHYLSGKVSADTSDF